MDASTSNKRVQSKTAVSSAGVSIGTSTLPISRVHKIIKADKDVRMCSKEAIFLISKLTEIATGKIMSQSQQTARLQKRAKTVKYDDLAANVARPEWMYLQDIIPMMMAKSQADKQRAQHPAHASNAGVGQATKAAGLGNKDFTGNPVKKARKPKAAVTADKKKDDEASEAVGARQDNQGRETGSASVGIEMEVDA